MLSQFISFDKDAIVLYNVEKFWADISKKSHSSDIIKNSKCVDFKDGTLFIKIKNASVKNEFFIKKGEIMEVINLYLNDKMDSKDIFVKKIILR